MRGFGRPGAGEQGPARPPLRPGALREGRAVSYRCGRAPGPREQRFQAARSQTKAAGEGPGSGVGRRHLALLRAVRRLRAERRGARALCLLPASRRHDAWGAGGEGKEAGPARPLCARAEATAPPACAPGPCTRARGGAMPGRRGVRTPAPGPNTRCGAVGGAANTALGMDPEHPFRGAAPGGAGWPRAASSRAPRPTPPPEWPKRFCLVARTLAGEPELPPVPSLPASPFSVAARALGPLAGHSAPPKGK